MSIQSRAYKLLCKLYRAVLHKMRVRQWMMEHGVLPGSQGPQRQAATVAVAELMEPRLLLDSTPALEPLGAAPSAEQLATVRIAEATAVIALPDGTFAAAVASDDPTPSVVLLSFAADGTIDSARTGALSSSSALHPTSMAVQKDGKILVAGSMANETLDFFVARFNSDGHLDSDFGNAGMVVTDLTGDADRALSVAVQADGRIVVAGYAPGQGGSYDFALVRYDRDGSVDEHFGNLGIVLTDFGGSWDYASSIVSLKDGGLLVVGSAFVGGSDDFAIARYKKDGQLDTSFGKGGKVTTDFAGGTDCARSAVLQSDGRLVVVGGATIGGQQDFAAARYNKDGSLDAAFGELGRTHKDVSGGDDLAYAAALQSDGHIVVGGQACAGVGRCQSALIRLAGDGTWQSGYAAGQDADEGRSSSIYSLALAASDSIIAVGGMADGLAYSCGMSLYEATGALSLTANYSEVSPGAGNVLNLTHEGSDPGMMLLMSSSDPVVYRLDNGDPDHSIASSWASQTIGYGNDAIRATGNSGSKVSTWTVSTATPGLYSVAATWVGGSGTTDVPYYIYDNNTLLGCVRVNQNAAPTGFADDGVTWQTLGSYTITSGIIKVTVTNATSYSRTVQADGVRIERTQNNATAQEVQLLEGATDIPDNTGGTLYTAPTGQAATKTFTIRNIGSQDLSLTGPIDVPDGYTVTSGDFTSVVLGPGEYHSFEVELSQGWTGICSGQIRFQTNDSDEGVFNFDVTNSALVTRIDDGGVGYATTGNWTIVTGAGYDGDSRVLYGAGGTSNATWTFGDLTPGVYRVSATWGAVGAGAPDVPWYVYDGGASAGIIIFDQTVGSSGFLEGGIVWQDLGCFTVTGNTLAVKETNATAYNRTIRADAVRIERLRNHAAATEVQVYSLDSGADVLDDIGIHTFTYATPGQSVTQKFAIRNTGSQDLSLTGPISVPDGYAVTSGDFTSMTLGPGESHAFDVELSQGWTGIRSGQVSFQTSDSDEGVFTFDVTNSALVTRIDDGGNGYTSAGRWVSGTGAGFENDSRLLWGGGGAYYSTWTFANLTPGVYRVSTTWDAVGSGATDVPWYVYDGSSIAGFVRVDQNYASSGFTECGEVWQDLGCFTVTGDTLVVKETNAIAYSRYIRADAVRIERVRNLTSGPEVQVLVEGQEVGNHTGVVVFSASSGQAHTETFVIRNMGSEDLVLTGPICVPDGYTVLNGDFSSLTLAPQETREVEIELESGWSGLVEGRISFATDDANDGTYDCEVTNVARITIIDDGDASFSTVGWWSTQTSGYLGDSRWTNGTDWSRVGIWTFGGLTPGLYRVSATWTSSSGSYDVPFYVYDGTSSTGSVFVDQRASSVGFSDAGATWQDIGYCALAVNDALVVKVYNGPSYGTGIWADGVRIEQVSSNSGRTLYWDPDGYAGNNDIDTGAGLGGTGTWANGGTSALWYDPVANKNVCWNNLNDDHAVILGTQAGGVAGPITISGSIVTGSITVGTDGYTIQSGSLGFSSDGGTVFIDTNVSTTLSTALTGGSLVKSGDGELILSGTNTYTGTTTISAGTLSVSSEDNLGANPASFTADQLALDGGTLKTTATFSIDDSNRGITLGTDGSTVEADSSTTLTVANVVAGGGSLTKDGSGSLTLGAANTFGGDTRLAAGTLIVGNASALQNSTLDMNAADSGSIDFNSLDATLGGLKGSRNLDMGGNALSIGNNGQSTEYSGVLGNGALTKDGSGELILSGSNTYTGTTTISAGVLSVSSEDNLGANPASFTADQLTLDGGTLKTTATFTIDDSNRGITLGAGGGTVQADSSATLTVANVTAGGGSLAKSGDGTVVLSGTNTYTGKTTVSAGVLSVSSEGNLGANPASFAADQLTLDGGTLKTTATFTIDDSNRGITLGAGGGTVEADSSSTLTVANVVAGGGSLTKDGSGALILSGTNTYTGKTTVSAGTLSISSEDNLGANPASFTADQLTLDGGTLKTTATFTIDDSNRGITLGTGGSTVEAGSSTTLTVASIIDGSGSLTKDGSGSLTLGAANTFGGDTRLAAGTLIVGNASALQNSTLDMNAADSGSIDFSTYDATLGGLKGSRSLDMDGRTLSIGNNGQSTEYSGVLSDGALAKIGSGTLTLSGSNTYTGKTTISAGTLSISAEDNLGANPASFTADQLTLDGGTLKTTATFTIDDSNRGITLGAGGGTLEADASTTLTVANVTAGSGSLAKSGDGTVVLSGTNTYTGKTTVSAGTLSISSEDNLGANPASFTADQLTLDGGTLKTTATFTIDDSNRGITLGAGGGTVQADSTTTLTVANVVAGGGSLTKDGSGALILSGTNTYTGKTKANAGTLSISSEDNLGANPTSFTADQLTLDGGTLKTTATFTIDDSNRGITLGSGGGTVQTDSSTTLTVANVIDGSGSLVKDGSGSLTLDAANTFSGDARLAAGTLIVGNVSALQNSTLDMNAADSGSIDFSTYDATLGGLKGSRSLDMDGRTLSIGNNGQSTEYSGVLSDGALAKIGSGTLTLSGSNTYTGKTTISAGTLSISAEDNLGANPASFTADQLTLDGGTLKTTATFIIDDSNRGITLGAGGGTLEADPSTTLTVANVIDGSGSLVKDGSGSLTLGAANTFSGDTRLAAGTLILGAVNALQNSTLDMNAADAGSIDFSTYDATLGGLKGSRNLDMGGRTLSIGNNGQSTEYSGALGNGALTKIGSGVLTLSGSNTYSGVTTVSAGTLGIQHANALGDTASGTTVSDGAALEIQGGITTAAEPLTINGSGTSGEGALRNVSGDNTYSGTVTLGSAARINSDSGTLTLSSGTAISGSYSLTFGGAGDVAVSSVIATASLTKDGPGVLTLSGANTYAGNTTISAGTLKLGASGVIPDGSGCGDVTVNGTLDLNGYSETINGLSGSGTVDNLSGSGDYGLYVGENNATSQFDGVIQNTSGTLALVKTGTGTLTLAGANTYSGDTTIGAGTLKLGASGAIPDGYGCGNVTVDGTLDLNGYSETINGLSGSGTVDNASGTGAYTLTVGGNDAYSTFNGTIQDTSGTLALTKMGWGTFTLSGSNTYSGETTVSEGVLNIQHANALGSTSSGTTISDGACLEIEGDITTAAEPLTLYGGYCCGTAWRNVWGDNTFTGPVTVASSATIESYYGTLTLNSPTAVSGGYGYDMLGLGGYGDIVVSSPIAFSGDIYKYGSGKLTFSGDNTYSGYTYVYEGTLNIQHANALGGTANGTYVWGGTIEVQGGISTAAEPVELYGSCCGASWRNVSGDNTFTGPITAYYYAWIDSDSGTLTLNSATAISGGDSYDYLVFGGTGNIVVSSPIAFSGSIIKDGSGRLTLSGDNTYSGYTDIYDGTLRIQHANALGSTSSETYVWSGTLEIEGGITTAAEPLVLYGCSGTSWRNVSGDNTFSGAVTVYSDARIDSDSGTLTLDSATALSGGYGYETLTFGGYGDIVVSSPIEFSGNIVKDGYGQLTLSGSNTYTGDTTVSAGTLKLGASGVIPDGSGYGNVTVNGTLDLNGHSETINGLSGSGNIDNIDGPACTLTVGGDDATSTFGGIIQDTSGMVALMKTGAGTLTLGGSNAYRGETRIAAGTLALGNASALQNSTLDMNAADAGSIDFSTYDATLGGLKGSRNVDMGGNTISIGSNNLYTTYGGVLSNGALIKVGTGTLWLTGANTYSGGTTVYAGTLRGTVPGSHPDPYVSAAASVNEGSELTANFYWNDSWYVAQYWTVNWGDGSPVETVPVGQYGTSATHVYADSHAGRQITATAMAADGAHTATPATVVVNNVAPSVSIVGQSTGLAGTAITLTGRATDVAGPNDPLSYSWAVTRDGQPYTLPPEVVTNERTLTFTPSQSGSYSATLTVTDGDSGSTPESHGITVSATGVVAASDGSGGVTIAWSSVSGADYYNILRDDILFAEQITATAYTDTESAWDSSYIYKVWAYGTGVNEQVGTSAAAMQAPDAVSNLEATVDAQERTVELTWTGSVSSGSYDVYRSTTQGQLGDCVARAVSATTWEDTYGQAGTFYYTIKAVNAQQESASSSQVTAVMPSAPSVPDAPSNAQIETAAGSVTVSWSAVTGATSYNVYKESTIVAMTAQTTWTDEFASSSSSSTYSVTAVNAAGESQNTLAGSAEPGAQYNPFEYCCGGLWLSFDGGDTASLAFRDADDDDYRFARMNASAAGMYGYFDESWQWHEITAADRAGFTYTFEYPAAWPSEEVGSGSTGSFLRLWIDDGLQENPPDTGDLDYIELGEEYTAEELGFGYCSGGTWIDTTAYFWAEGVNAVANASIILRVNTNLGNNDVGRTYDDATASVYHLWTDLEVDADNNDFSGLPEGTTAEEGLEDGTPSKYIALPFEDREKYVPIVVELLNDVIANQTVTFTFASPLALYKADKTAITSEQEYTVSALGLSAGRNTLYMKGTGIGGGSIAVELGAPDIAITVDDSVNATVIDQIVACACCGSSIGPDGDYFGQDSYAGSPVEISADGQDMVIGAVPELIFCGNAVAIFEGDEIRLYDFPGFQPRTEGQGIFERTTSGFCETRPDGTKYLFAATCGKLQSQKDPGGNETEQEYNEDGTIASTTTVSGDITTTVSYTYSDGRVTSTETTEQETGQQAVNVRKAYYTYYGAEAVGGNEGDLKLITIKDDQNNVVEEKYYRYYKSGESNGFQHGIKMYFDGPSFARLKQAVSGWETADDSTVKPYATDYFEYDSQQRVTTRSTQGGGCSSMCDGIGTSIFEYTVSSNTDGYNSWKYKQVEKLPGYDTNDPYNTQNTSVTVYSNFAGQTMLQITKQDATGTAWYEYTRYDDEGRTILTASTSAITGFDEQYADLLHEVDGNLYYLDDDSGVIYVTEYYAATTATETTAGGVEGYFHQSSVQQGELDTPVLQSHVEYFARHIQGKSAYPTANSTVYRNTDGTGAETTSYAYTWIPNTLQTQTTVVSLPVVSTAQNGSGTANQSTTVYDSFGRVTWTKDAEGFLTHMAYDDATGAVVKMITDVDTTETGDFTGLPSGWSTPTGGGAHLITQYEVDSLGRTVKNTDANGVVSYTVYRDDEYTDSGTGAKITGEVRTYPNWDSTNHRPNGPISISRMIVVGEYRYSEYLTVSVSPSLDGSNEPTGLETFMASDIQSLSRTYYNVGGQTTESRQYSDLTGVTYSTAANLGTKGTNYLSTIYSYNRRGWMKRIEDSAGTIRRIVYDNLGRTLSEWIGTDDTPTSGSWSPDNMTGTDLVQLSATIYDGGSTGDGLVTASRTFFGSGANDYYETVYDYDWRNRQIGSRGPDNVASLSTLDNLGQVTMSQIYVDADTDFVIDSGELRAKNEAFYDDQGRTYKTVTYSIDPSDGSQLGSVIDSQTWYNPRGMVMKTSDALGLFSKTQYDGAGRAVASYASLDSTEFSSPSYGDADDVSGDTVLNVTVTVYSGDRVSQIKRGTVYGGENDNMVAVQKYWYDTTADGNGSETGRLTGVSTLKALATLAGTSADYVTTLYQYDSAGRQNVTITPDPDGAGGLLPTKYESTYDLLGRPTYSKTFKKDGQTETLLSQSRSLYNSAGQASASRVYEVASGSAGDYLETTYAYDGLGRQVKTTQPNGAFTKTLYDSWGRVTGSYLGTDEGATVDATNVTADTIVEQTIPYYDSLGRVWMTVSYQRHDDGSGTGALTTSNARATYDVIWFDDLGRTRWSATYGDNGGTAITSQSYDFDGDGDGEDYSDAEMTTRTSANSDDYILSQAAYNGYGQVFETTDNKGLKTRTYFDDVGRKTYVAENYDDFGFSSGNPVNTGDSTDHSKDRVTRYVYNVFGLLTQLVALDANGDGTQTDNETTSYVYALDLQASAAGSPVKDNALLRAVSYPDGDSAATTISTLNAGNTGDFVATTYVASGLEATRTDQREVEHTYAYDFLGRRTANAVTDYPASVDDTVLRIEWAYDDLGRVASVTSYDAATSGNIVNQVTFTYDGWSNVTSSKQEHDGEVDGSTPQVQYTYADGASGGVALYNRLTKVTYPDGREVFYNYPSSGIGAVLSRLDNIADDAGGTTKYAQYTYLGASTIVQVAHPAVQNNLVLSYGTGGTYAGWDRFGRVIQQTWTVNGSAVDSYAYGYDMNSNRLYRENLKTSNFDELYSYDGLNRLEEMNRGNLDGSKLFLTSTAFGQAWTLDQLGNWTGFDDNGTSQTRTHNAVNEITGISNWADPAYDAAGNMIRGPKPGSTSDLQHYTYDAWNRMAAVKADSSGEPGATIAVYEFDGLNRRIEETAGLDTQDFFFNEQWQVLEVRLNGDADPLEQCLWDIRYIDAMVVRWFDGNTDGDYADLNYLDGNQELVIGVDSILFCCQDANMNTTAVVDGAAAQSSVTAGEVVEYYAFSAYGVPIVLEADWTVRPDGSAYKNWSLFAGYYFDEPSGLYLVRNRVYQAEVGRWIQRDPVGYVDGSDLYEYTRSQPAQHGDPYGTITVDTENPDIRQAWARLHNRNSPTANRLISLLEGFELCLNVPIIITITASSSTGSQGGFIEGAPQSYWTTRNGNPIQQVLDEVDIAGLGLITINPLQKVLAGTMSLWTTQGVRSGWPLDEAIVHEASHVLQGLVDYARRNNIRCCFVHNGLQPPTAVPASARGYYSFETGPYEFNAVTNWENSYLSDIGAGYQRLAHSVRSYDELISLLSSTPGAGDSDAGRRLVDELDARMQMEFLVESDQSRQFRIGQGGDLLGLPVFPYDENAYRTVFQPGLAAAIALDNAPDIARYQSAVRARFGWMLYFGSAAFDDKMNGL